MKKVIRIFAVLLLIAVGCGLIASTGEILVRKSDNRYFMLEKELERRNESYDVQIYGSCHAYTSFNSMILINGYDISCYNMSNPGEIIPATYLRMLERFKTDPPKVALVEIWGINAYETYSSTSDILNHYFQLNMERIPFSLDKMEVINDFESLRLIEENVPFVKYKDRLLELPLPEVEYNYSFDLCRETYEDTIPRLYEEMAARFWNNGYVAKPASPILDYPEQQAKIGSDEMLPVEADLVKYLDKIIALCQEYSVELIFYRAPYRSTVNELRKANWLDAYLEERGVLYLDMEEEITFDYATDFHDYEHLALSGGNKVTWFLVPYILYRVNG